MFVTPEGKEIFVVDGHTHFWDGSPENQRNIHGKQFIECFYGYHMALSPPEQRWEKSKFEKYSARRPLSATCSSRVPTTSRSSSRLISRISTRKQGVLLPYIMGHENAGWIEDVGSGVKSVKPGDAVICHPLRSCGVCLNCRYGEDMHCTNGLFPGLGLDGGFAQYLLTNERALIKLNPNITPLDVAPMADAGITAYRAAKKAAKFLRPGAYCVLLGIGGLGHIALQCLHAMSGCRTIAIDRGPRRRNWPRNWVPTSSSMAARTWSRRCSELTGGGAQVVIDFVGELGVENLCWKMVRKGGQMYVVGYGGKVEVPTVHFVIEEINVGGSLVGNYTELVELMELNADGKVKMHYSQYKLANINTALDDFKNRRFAGRGVIVP